MICDMGFVIQDSKNAADNKMNRLVKKNDTHLVIVTYEIRDRLVCPPEPEDNPDLITKLRPHTFGHFLKKHGLVPPNMMGAEFDED